MKKTYPWYRMLLGIISFIMLLFCTGCQEEVVTFKIAEVQRSYGIISTKQAGTLDFTGVPAFFVTNSLLVQCSFAVLLYFYGCKPVHLSPSIYAP